MKLWTPVRRRAHDPITEALADAAARNVEVAKASADAHDQVADAVEAEQDQLRRNSLGALVHDAFTFRRRNP